MIQGECWLEIALITHLVYLDVLQQRRVQLVVVRQAVDPLIFQADVQEMTQLEGMFVCIGVFPFPGVKQPAHKATVHVCLGVADRTRLLLVEVEQMSLDGSKIRAISSDFTSELLLGKVVDQILDRLQTSFSQRGF